MIIECARVSTDNQSLDGKIDALKAAGAEKIFAEEITGTARSRPEQEDFLGIAFEFLPLWFVAFHVRQPRNAVTLQAPMQC